MNANLRDGKNGRRYRWRLRAALLPLVLTGASALAGTITLDPANQLAPSVSIQGSVVQDIGSTLEVQEISVLGGETVKVLGNASFTSTGGDSIIRISLSGTFSAQAGDRFFVDYIFTATLDEEPANIGSITYAVTGQAIANTIFGPVPFESSSTGGPLTGGTQLFQDSDQSDPVPLSASGTFTGFLEINWQDAAAGDRFVLNVPANSIDFTLGTVPEPSSALLAGAGLLVFGRRRRA